MAAYQSGQIGKFFGRLGGLGLGERLPGLDQRREAGGDDQGGPGQGADGHAGADGHVEADHHRLGRRRGPGPRRGSPAGCGCPPARPTAPCRRACPSARSCTAGRRGPRRRRPPTGSSRRPSSRRRRPSAGPRPRRRRARRGPASSAAAAGRCRRPTAGSRRGRRRAPASPGSMNRTTPTPASTRFTTSAASGQALLGDVALEDRVGRVHGPRVVGLVQPRRAVEQVVHQVVGRVGQHDPEEGQSEQPGVEVVVVDGEQAGDEPGGERHGQHRGPGQEEPLADDVHLARGGRVGGGQHLLPAGQEALVGGRVRSCVTAVDPSSRRFRARRPRSRAEISSLPPLAATLSLPAPGVMSSLPLPPQLVGAGVAVHPVVAAGAAEQVRRRSRRSAGRRRRARTGSRPRRAR